MSSNFSPRSEFMENSNNMTNEMKTRYQEIRSHTSCQKIQTQTSCKKFKTNAYCQEIKTHTTCQEIKAHSTYQVSSSQVKINKARDFMFNAENVTTQIRTNRHRVVIQRQVVVQQVTEVVEKTLSYRSGSSSNKPELLRSKIETGVKTKANVFRTTKPSGETYYEKPIRFLESLPTKNNISNDSNFSIDVSAPMRIKKEAAVSPNNKSAREDGRNIAIHHYDNKGKKSLRPAGELSDETFREELFRLVETLPTEKNIPNDKKFFWEIYFPKRIKKESAVSPNNKSSREDGRDIEKKMYPSFGESVDDNVRKAEFLNPINSKSAKVPSLNIPRSKNELMNLPNIHSCFPSIKTEISKTSRVIDGSSSGKDGIATKSKPVMSNLTKSG